MRLGIATDTEDITGTVLTQNETTVTQEQLLAVLPQFRGEIMQIPPMYSALKVNGKKLYDLARAGKEVERQPRPITIHRLELLEFDGVQAKIVVECSKGTYIRTLCADIGKKLGCGGAMESLTRLRVGDFHIEDSLTLDRIGQLTEAGRIGSFIIPCEEVFLHCFRAHTVPEADRKLYNGNELSFGELGLGSHGAGEMIRACDSSGRFIAVYRLAGSGGSYRPYRMLG